MPSNRGNVLVIGAGIAGLAAAGHLKDSGYSVLVIESRDRSGGRIWTDRSLNVPIDLGAAWIHGKSKNPIFELALKNGIKTAPSSFANACLIGDDGKKVSGWRQLQFAGRANRILPRLKRLARRLDKDVSVADGVAMLLDRMHMSDREECFLNRHLIEFQALNGASLDEQSLFALANGAIAYEGGDLLFPAGFSQVIDALSGGIEIRHNETVTKVRHDSKSVVVETKQTTYEADAIVITLPLGVLKSGRVTFDPELPAYMSSSISKLQVGSFNKVAMRFDVVFWPVDCDLIEMVPASSRLVCQIVNWYKFSGEPVLIGCIAADTAREWERWTDQEIVGSMVGVLKRLFGNIVPEPSLTAVTRWGQDEFALGAYSVVHPGATARDFDALAEPVGRLFFAGEATERSNQGTVTGAYLSGIRAARQIANGTSPTIPRSE